MATLLEKIKTHEAKVVVIGIGYVGLALVRRVRAGRVPRHRLRQARARCAASTPASRYIGDISDAVLAPLVVVGQARRHRPIPTVLGEADVRRRLRADAAQQDEGPGHRLHRRRPTRSRRTSTRTCSIVLESTTYPGTTREVLAARSCTETGLELGKDVFVAFSPERVDPGNERYHTKNTPKVIGGIDAACLEVGQALYATSSTRSCRSSSTDAAEMVQAPREHVPRGQHRPRQRGRDHVRQARHRRLGGHRRRGDEALRLHAVLSRAPASAVTASRSTRSTCRGSCARSSTRRASSSSPTTINSAMPDLVVERVSDALNDAKKPVNGSKILVSGVAYKNDIADLRESPAFDVIELSRRWAPRSATTTATCPRCERARRSRRERRSSSARAATTRWSSSPTTRTSTTARRLQGASSSSTRATP